MTAALTLVVLIATGDASDPVSSAMTRAARQALGPETRVIVRELAPGVDDARAVALGRTLRADAIIEVTWRDTDHRHAHLHVRSEADGRWVDREIGFDARDADGERGRTLGFALVSMMPDHGDDLVPQVVSPLAESPTAPAQSPRAPAVVTSTPGTTPKATTTTTEAASRPFPPPMAAVDGAADADADDDRNPRRFTVDAAVSGGLGIGGVAGGFGGALYGGFAVLPRLVLRAGVGARAGDFAPAQATSLFVSASAGARFVALLPSRVQPLGVSLRVDGMVLRTSLSRGTATAIASNQARVTPGVGTAIEGSVRLGGRFTLFIDVGSELALGATEVFVKGESVATIPVVHAFGELGLRTEL